MLKRDLNPNPKEKVINPKSIEAAVVFAIVVAIALAIAITLVVITAVFVWIDEERLDHKRQIIADHSEHWQTQDNDFYTPRPSSFPPCDTTFRTALQTHEYDGTGLDSSLTFLFKDHQRTHGTLGFDFIVRDATTRKAISVEHFNHIVSESATNMVVEKNLPNGRVTLTISDATLPAISIERNVNTLVTNSTITFSATQGTKIYPFCS